MLPSPLIPSPTQWVQFCLVLGGPHSITQVHWANSIDNVFSINTNLNSYKSRINYTNYVADTQIHPYLCSNFTNSGTLVWQHVQTNLNVLMNSADPSLKAIGASINAGIALGTLKCPQGDSVSALISSLYRFFLIFYQYLYAVCCILSLIPFTLALTLPLTLLATVEKTLVLVNTLVLDTDHPAGNLHIMVTSQPGEIMKRSIRPWCRPEDYWDQLAKLLVLVLYIA